MKPTLLILAAGIGSRYGGLKQIDVVGEHGEAIIDYSIYDAIRSGFGKIVFVIRKNIKDDFKDFIENKFLGKIDIQYVFQELDMLPKGYVCPEERVKPWGTGHAILCAKEYINEPFAVINSDDFYGRSSLRLVAKYLSKVCASSTQFAMVGYLLKNTLSNYGSVSRGICEVKNALLKNIVEKTNIKKKGFNIEAELENGNILTLSGDETVSLNLFGFTPKLFEYLENNFYNFLDANIHRPKSEYFIPSVVQEIIEWKKGIVKVLNSEDEWFGITYRQDKIQAQQSIRSLVNLGQYPSKLW